MQDIEDKQRLAYAGMAFSSYADDMARAAGIKAAVAVIIDKAILTYEDDLRADERFIEALTYLNKRAGQDRLLKQIRHALDIPTPEARRFTLDHLTGLLAKRLDGHFIGNFPGQF